jgi:putative FmdB family regulatory protein
LPVFEYKCTSCGAREEHVLLGDEKPPTACKECAGALKRVYSGRLHVELNSWGFSKTDALLSGDLSKKDFKALKERAQRIADE